MNCTDVDLSGVAQTSTYSDTESVYSDSDMFMSGGGGCLYPQTHTKEQEKAEIEVRAVLFKDIEKKYYNNYTINTVYAAASNSPMFQNTDEITAINDFGLSIQTNIDTRNPAANFNPKTIPIGTEPLEAFGIAAANDEAETTVDDFFPAPFIPFTM